MSRSRVVVELQGGLGNQLFGWAAGFALSQKLGCGLSVDTSNLYQRGYQLENFRLSKNIEISSNPNPLLRKINKIFYRNIFHENSFEYDPRFEEINAPKILRGYFQSWKYHSNIKNEIYDQVRNVLSESPQLRELRKKFAFENLIGIHVRRGDYKELEHYHGTIKEGYYKKAISKVRLADKTTSDYIVFSDEPNEARLIVPGAIAYIGPHELSRADENMILMSSCKSLIGANSSFSLWSGLLMEPESKVRIFPKRWFAEKSINDSDLVPENFIRLQDN